jgi:tetratricopeptide (TPR) repeat protein/cellulose biosynthesis protein BcsQ
MNVAHRLCERGKKVCVLDFDLEAPGLDSFQDTRRSPINPGVVEYITSSLVSDETPDLLDYSYDVTPSGSNGAIFLIPSGRRDTSYQQHLSKLDWKLLYRQKNGYLIIEALKRSIENEFQADYLLVDSRTGLTDVSGICTFQLPDLVVLLFNLNDQNIDGTAQVYKSILNNKLHRPIQTLLVASPIPDLPDSFEIRSKRFDLARRAIGSAPDLILPYDPFMAFQETILPDHQSNGLSKGYRELTDRLMAKNNRDVMTLLSVALRLRESGEMELADLKYREILDLYPNSGEAWFEFGRFARICRNISSAVDAFTRATSFPATQSKAYAELILTHIQMGKVSEAKNYLTPMLSIAADGNDLVRVAEAFSDSGEFLGADEALSKARTLNQLDEFAVLWLRAQVLAGMKDYPAAFKAYDELRQGLPSSLSPVFNAGAMAALAGIPQAKEILKKAVELFEASAKDWDTRESVNIFSAISFAYDYLGNQSEAINCLQTALTISEKIERSRIFLFPEYKYVPYSEFAKAISDRLSDLITRGPLLQ